MTKSAKWFLVIVMLSAALLALIWSQGRSVLEVQLKHELAARGLSQVDFTVGAVGTKGITLENISFGYGLTLQSLTVGYSLLQLFHGDVQTVAAGSLSFKHDHATVTLDTVQAVMEPIPGGVKGKWNIPKIKMEGMPLPIPALRAEGHFSWQDGAGILEGELAGSEKAQRAAFTLTYPQADRKAMLTIRSVSLPWNGGILQAHGVTVPLYGSEPITVPLELQRVSLDALLQEATGKRATATGAVSGTVPVVLRRDGTFTLRTGTLKALQPGTLALSSDVIPGDHTQVAQLRALLKDFRYTEATLSVNSDNAKKLSILLSLRGNNPDVYNGREVNLNVNLTGDVLELIQQSVLPLNNPSQLIKEGEYEKN